MAAEHIRELQQMLQDDDCFLPHHVRPISALCRNAVLEGDGTGLEALRDGIDRQREQDEHAWKGRVGDRITYRFDQPACISRIRLVMDSDLDRETLPRNERLLNRNLFHNRLLTNELSCVPPTLVKAYRVIAQLQGGFGGTGQSLSPAPACACYSGLCFANPANSGNLGTGAGAPVCL